MVTLTRDGASKDRAAKDAAQAGAAQAGAAKDGAAQDKVAQDKVAQDGASGGGASGGVAPGPAARTAKRAPDDAARPLKRDMPLVPADTIAGRALVTVIAIMTFLAALTAGTALLVAGAAGDWQTDVSRAR